MKTIDAKIPGIIDLFVDGNLDKYIIRRDFIDTYDHLKFGVCKRIIRPLHNIKPILEAGLLFFKELNIHGYTIEGSYTKGILRGYHLESDKMLQAVTIYGLNEVLKTNLSHDELTSICNKLSINMDSYITDNRVYFDQSGQIVDRNEKTDDIYYLLLKLPDGFTQEELVRYFMKDESFSLEFDELKRYHLLIHIKNVLMDNDAKQISTNGFSNILVASFDDVHKRFKASKELSFYETHKYNEGNSFSFIKCYK